MSSMSDKAVLERAIKGDLEAVSLLAKRFCYEIDDPAAVQYGLRQLKVLSINAAKRIIQANSHA